MPGPTSSRTSVRKPRVVGGSAPVDYSNQNPTSSPAPDIALLLIERIEKRVDRLDEQLSNHHDELTRFRASISMLAKLAAAPVLR
jgi:hypothetical protein